MKVILADDGVVARGHRYGVWRSAATVSLQRGVWPRDLAARVWRNTSTARITWDWIDGGRWLLDYREAGRRSRMRIFDGEGRRLAQAEPAYTKRERWNCRAEGVPPRLVVESGCRRGAAVLIRDQRGRYVAIGRYRVPWANPGRVWTPNLGVSLRAASPEGAGVVVGIMLATISGVGAVESTSG